MYLKMQYSLKSASYEIKGDNLPKTTKWGKGAMI